MDKNRKKILKDKTRHVRVVGHFKLNAIKTRVLFGPVLQAWKERSEKVNERLKWEDFIGPRQNSPPTQFTCSELQFMFSFEYFQ